MNQQLSAIIYSLRDTNLDIAQVTNAAAHVFALVKFTSEADLRQSIQDGLLLSDFDSLFAWFKENGTQPIELPVVANGVYEWFVESLLSLISAQVISHQDMADALNGLLAEKGKISGESVIPAELKTLGVSLLEDKAQSVYCPFPASYQFAELLAKNSQVAFEANSLDTVYFATVRAYLLDVSYRIKSSDPIQKPSFITVGGFEQFSSCIAFPAFNQKYDFKASEDLWARFPEKSFMGEVYHLRHMLAHSSGRVVSFVANSFLTRTAAGEKQFKQSILKNKWLKAVIALPSNLLNNTNIPVNVLVLDKSKPSDKVRFIDVSADVFAKPINRIGKKLERVDDILALFASEEENSHACFATRADIEANDYNISPSRYVMSSDDKYLAETLQKHPHEPLDELVDFIRPQAIKNEENGECKFQEVSLAGINEIGELNGNFKEVNTSTKLGPAVKQSLKNGDVLIVCKGAIGKLALVEQVEPEQVIASQAFAIARIKPHVQGVTPEYLYQVLSSNIGQLQLQNRVSGTTASMISAKDLKSIQIPLLDTAQIEQAKQIRVQVKNKYSELLKLQTAIATLNQQVWF